MTEPRASYRCEADGERVVAIRFEGDDRIVTTISGERTITYHHVNSCPYAVGDVLEEPLRHRWHTIQVHWHPWIGEDDD